MGRNAEFANGWDHEKVAKYHKIDAMAKGGTTPGERAAWEGKRQAFVEKHGGGVPPGQARPQTRPQPQKPQAQPRPQRPQASSGETFSTMSSRHHEEWLAMDRRHTAEYRAASDAGTPFGNLFSRHDKEKAGLFNRHDQEKRVYFRDNP